MDPKTFPWYWLPEDYSTHGAGIDQLITIIHWFMALLFVGWGIFYLYCLFRFRHRDGHKATYEPITAKVSKYAEVGVLVFEIVLLLGISMPIWAKYKNEPPKESEATMVRVVAEQFAWNFHYPGKDGKFGPTKIDLISGGDNPLGLDLDHPDAKDDFSTVNVFHFPVNKPVYIKLSSKDVIHGFGIHGLRMKQDAVPGMEIPIWFQASKLPPPPFEEGKGHFELACSQLCGLGHYRMGAQVYVDSPEDFAKWEAEYAPPPPEPEEPAPEPDAGTEGVTP